MSKVFPVLTAILSETLSYNWILLNRLDPGLTFVYVVIFNIVIMKKRIFINEVFT